MSISKLERKVKLLNILKEWQDKKFVLTNSTGTLAPGGLKIVEFGYVTKTLVVRSYKISDRFTSIITFPHGVYVVNSDGTISNVNRTIRSMARHEIWPCKMG